MTYRAPSGALLALTVVLLSACSTVPNIEDRPSSGNASSGSPSQPPVGESRTPPARRDYFALANPLHTQEMVIYALGLLDTGYLFGGRNPDAGLDCSGMVSYIVEQVSGRRLPHNAAQIAGITRPIPREALQPGDLVFFNTRNTPYSHMGIYMGDGRFVHAPSSRGRVRIERMDSTYFKKRFDGARTLIATG